MLCVIIYPIGTLYSVTTCPPTIFTYLPIFYTDMYVSANIFTHI